MKTSSILSQKQIFWFWLPLAVMWLIMATQQPSVTAVVSRLPEPTMNLAAFGLSFSFALIIESPVIMLLSAGTALATNRQSFGRLLQFTHVMAFSLTVLHLVMVLTPLYGWILRDVIGTPPELIETSRVALLWLLPWTGMIAYRRLFEGVMIRYGHPQRVTWVIVARLLTILAVLLMGLAWGQWPGAYVSGLAVSVGVTVGALMAWWLVRPTLRDEMPELTADDEVLTWDALLRFYTPLALTSLITMVGQPILAFGLSRAHMPLESLAVWPVLMALGFVGRSVGLGYQEVTIALLEDETSFMALRRFAFMLAAISSGLFALFAVTPLNQVWYRDLSGLPPVLVEMATLPTIIISLLPALTVFLAWYRGMLVKSKHTTPISMAVTLNMLTLFILMMLFPYATNVSGVVLGALAFTLSLCVECFYLWYQSRSAIHQFTLVEVALGD